MIVKDIAFTTYPANDVAAVRRWYEKNLGLQFAGAYIRIFGSRSRFCVGRHLRGG